MTRSEITDHEFRARNRKANALASILREYGITRDLAKRMTTGEWRSVAKFACCNPPNSQATLEAVYELLAETTPKPQPISIEEFRRISA